VTDSNSKRPVTSDISSTDTTLPSPTSAAQDDEHEHEHKCTCISPLDTSHQVPLVAAPQLEKLEEPPPVLLTDTDAFAPNSQVVQDHPNATNAHIFAQLRELKDEHHNQAKFSKLCTRHTMTASMTIPFGNLSPLHPEQCVSCLHPVFLHDGGRDTACLPAILP